MVMPLRAGGTQPSGVQSLPPRLHVLHAYTRLKMSSSRHLRWSGTCLSPHLPEEGSAGGKSGFCITCPTHRAVPRVGSHSGDGGQVVTPICGGETDQTPREVESGWSQQLDSPECHYDMGPCTCLP